VGDPFHGVLVLLKSFVQEAAPMLSSDARTRT